jgi:hypothetical protein
MTHSATLEGEAGTTGMPRPLLDDLRAACAGLTAGQWGLIVAKCTCAAASDTAGRRAAAVGATAKATVCNVQRYLRLGVRHAAADDLSAGRATLAAMPGQVVTAITEFGRLSRAEQADEVAQLILTWVVFYASAGGADLEGGLPDLDIALAGMGAHRTIFTHSILLGLGVETGLRFALAMIDALVDRMPATRHPVWSQIAGASRRLTDRSATAVWAGIGLHLIKDAGLLTFAATKPVVHLPVHLSMAGHKLFLAANGAASVIAAKPEQAPKPRHMGTIRL